MQASQHIKQLSFKLKQFLKQCAEKNQFSSDLAQTAILESLSPLARIYAEQVNVPREVPVINTKEIEDPYIYALITEYLCRKNLVDIAKILLEEIDEMFPFQEETDMVPVFRKYCSWSDELGKPLSYEIVRKSFKFQQIENLKAQCKKLIRSCKESSIPSDPVSVMYRIVEKALSAVNSYNRMAEEDKMAFQKAVSDIRSQFILENNSLVYFDGKLGHIYSKESYTYREVQMVLGLFVIPARSKEITRLIHIKKVDWPSEKIPLETLYYVGKTMEKINMLPYSSDIEIESAVPPALSFHSTFFCPILRCECSVDNPPCILTCGHAISVRALEKITSFKGLIFKCPYCPKDANIKDVFKAKLFI